MALVTPFISRRIAVVRKWGVEHTQKLKLEQKLFLAHTLFAQANTRG